MSANIDILLRVKDDSSGTLQNAATNIKGLGEAAQQADAKLKQAAGGSRAFAETAGKIDSAGRQARIGLSSMAQAAQLVGVDISGIVGPAASAADAIGDMVGAVGSLGLAAGAVGALVAAVGVAKFAIDQYNKSIAETILYHDQYLQSAYILTSQNKSLADSFEKVKEATIATQQISPQWILEHNQYSQGLIVSLKLLGIQYDTLEDKLQKARASFEAASFGARSGYDEVEHLRGAYDNLVVTGESADAILLRLSQAHQTAAQAAAAQAAEEERLTGILAGNVNAAASMAQAEATVDGWMTRVGAGNKAYNEVVQRGTKLIDDNNAALQRWAEQGAQMAAQAAQRVRDTIRSLVEQALTPTEVTLEDLNAAMAGKYIPKWDEFRRRVEAVATGTNIEQFGPKFKAQLEMVQGMFKDLNLDQIAAKLKDFSLFANMDTSSIKQLVDFGPIEQQVSEQVDAIIGKEKLMKAAFDDVWVSLSTQKKIDLANALGFDASTANIEGLKNQIQNAVTGATDGIADTATQGLTNGLNAAATTAGTLSKTIASNLNPGMVDLKKAIDPLIPSLQSAGDTLTKTTNPAFGALDTSTKNILASLQGIKSALDDDLKSFDAWVSGMPAYQTTIQNLITNALEPLQNTLDGIENALQRIIDKAKEAAGALAGMGAGNGSGANTTTGAPNAPGFQRGADFIVPPGFPNDSFPFRGWLTSGERVTITPAPQARATGSTFIFNVTVDSDARSQQLARRVRALAAHGVA